MKVSSIFADVNAITIATLSENSPLLGFSCMCLFVKLKDIGNRGGDYTLADLGGVSGARPYGTQFFRFGIHFH